MKQKLIITNLTRADRLYTACALYEGNTLLEVSCEPKEQKSILGNIYVGRVKDIVKNLNAAFIEISPGHICYYPLEEYEKYEPAIFVKKINSPKLVQGDEVVVQVIKESMKTKPPRVTTNINITGKYIVLTTGNTKLGISKKMTAVERERIHSMMLPLKEDRFGFVVRTNAAKAEEEQIKAEFKHLKQVLLHLLETAKYRTCFSRLYEEQIGYLNYLQNIHTDSLDSVLTDDRTLYDEMSSFLNEKQRIDLEKLTFYDDPKVTLLNLYGLSSHVENALKERVWLKSGAYLVIQPTEALTVIDVNSGKSVAKKNPQEHYLKINLEAARELAYQLRLRNISGIIVVDFIDLIEKEAKKMLMDTLRAETKADPVPVQVVDMTKLNLVELTRKKIHKSLAEQLEAKTNK
ncbi:ribonuclease E/G [Lachnospiraceae bacterium ZAX-1]